MSSPIKPVEVYIKQEPLDQAGASSSSEHHQLNRKEVSTFIKHELFDYSINLSLVSFNSLAFVCFLEIMTALYINQGL